MGYVSQPFVRGEYDGREKEDIRMQEELLGGFYRRQGCVTAATVSDSKVDVLIFNRTGGTSFEELKCRDPKYDDDGSTTMIESEKLAFLAECVRNGAGAFLVNMYEGAGTAHLFHINAIVHLLDTFERKKLGISWKMGCGSGKKFEERVFIPNRLAYRIEDGCLIRLPEDNREVPPPVALDFDTSRKITKDFWNEQQETKVND